MVNKRIKLLLNLHKSLISFIPSFLFVLHQNMSRMKFMLIDGLYVHMYSIREMKIAAQIRERI